MHPVQDRLASANTIKIDSCAPIDERRRLTTSMGYNYTKARCARRISDTRSPIAVLISGSFLILVYTDVPFERPQAASEFREARLDCNHPAEDSKINCRCAAYQCIIR